ncbi:two-component system, NtrC family, response regulator HydG [Maridesulfovibrio ferrireducens]|uniref:Two-component system, NtrC family, response regulator HydG n=1 Tax=Maridesulfovibrio ferrireducens TaxID=246191 RepID=A0A1G9IC17_9BACT|nr:sigma-54 dependent transcriptional regulator [Maridesulfovibrio ferrireducens]SDL22672.1 two-component system, NtrC family, response regulator HydG [Maridesulfovibrio ferrireducens]
MKATILIVDDEKGHLAMLETVLGGWGYSTSSVTDGAEAITAVKDQPYDAVLMDVRMATVSGIEALEEIKAFNPAIPVLIMTAYSSVEIAVEAMKLGAYDYLTKPLNFDELKIILERALDHRRLSDENRSLKEAVSPEQTLGGIIGSSPAMAEVTEMVKVVAPTEATVLITGESGTGKELVARAIHFNSNRKHKQLVTINCAALSETLLESELFGHEKGAFTGADKRRDGRFMQANKGTIFLDEIGEIPLPMQAKLLRAVQEREVQRLGSDTPLPVDVRIVAATNRDLKKEVEKGNFREDLYYRLHVMALKMPALRDRQDDVPLLANFFLKQFADKNRKKIIGFTPVAMDMLIRHSWPGNVRELENTVERAVILSMGEYVTEKELPPSVVESYELNESTGANTLQLGGQPLEAIQKQAILATLEKTCWNKSEASKILNITRTTLNNKLKKYGM